MARHSRWHVARVSEAHPGPSVAPPGCSLRPCRATSLPFALRVPAVRPTAAPSPALPQLRRPPCRSPVARHSAAPTVRPFPALAASPLCQRGPTRAARRGDLLFAPTPPHPFAKAASRRPQGPDVSTCARTTVDIEVRRRPAASKRRSRCASRLPAPDVSA